MTICSICKEDKDDSEFSLNKKKNTKVSYCKPCRAAYDIEYNLKEKEAYKQWISDIGCEACGFNHADALEVHHFSQEYKRFGRSQDKRYNVQDVGLNYAIVLCANCHNIFHGFHGGKNAPFPLYNKLQTVNIVRRAKGDIS